MAGRCVAHRSHNPARRTVRDRGRDSGLNSGRGISVGIRAEVIAECHGQSRDLAEFPFIVAAGSTGKLGPSRGEKHMSHRKPNAPSNTPPAAARRTATGGRTS